MYSFAARTQELWPILKARLNTVRMGQILGAVDRIYRVPPDDVSQPEGAEDASWGRLVLVTPQRLWPIAGSPYAPRNVAFVVRVEVNALRRTDYNPEIPLESAHVEAFLRLEGFQPTVRADGVTPLKFMMMAEAIYRYSPPELPVYDEARNVWVASAEYRCRISNDIPPS
jgi:hypothetical protein